MSVCASVPVVLVVGEFACRCLDACHAVYARCHFAGSSLLSGPTTFDHHHKISSLTMKRQAAAPRRRPVAGPRKRPAAEEPSNSGAEERATRSRSGQPVSSPRPDASEEGQPARDIIRPSCASLCRGGFASGTHVRFATGGFATGRVVDSVTRDLVTGLPSALCASRPFRS